MQLRLILHQHLQCLGPLYGDRNVRGAARRPLDLHLHHAQFGRVETHGHPLNAILTLRSRQQGRRDLLCRRRDGRIFRDARSGGCSAVRRSRRHRQGTADAADKSVAGATGVCASAEGAE